MSLINQMLQDLEHRSVSNPIAEGMQHIRAVPEREGIHPAWWLVLVLTLLLIGGSAWFFLHPTPNAPSASSVSLRMTQTLPASPAVVVPTTLGPEPTKPITTTPPAVVAPAVIAPSPPPDELPAVSDTEPPKMASMHRETVLPKARNRTPLALAPTVPVSSDIVAAAPNKMHVSSELSDKDADIASPMSAKLTKQVQELTPQQNAENDYRKAGIALQAGRQDEATTDLEQALQLDAQNAAARQMLVGVLLQAKRTDDAMHRAQEGLALDPAQVGLAMILARVQIDKSDLHAALATLEHSLNYASERADYQAFYAALLQRDKRHKEAIEHYVAALGKEPQNGVWWMGLGISLQAENHLPEAKEAFNRAKSSNTLSADLLNFVNQKLLQLR